MSEIQQRRDAKRSLIKENDRLLGVVQDLINKRGDALLQVEQMINEVLEAKSLLHTASIRLATYGLTVDDDPRKQIIEFLERKE